MTGDRSGSDVVISLDQQVLAASERFTVAYESDPGEALTVEAWVDARSPRLEGMQALVSQWTPPDAFAGFSAFDATDLHGLITRGDVGAVFDGR